MLEEVRVNDPLILRDRLACGVVMTAQQRDQVMAVARRVEASGFDSIWVGDHISFYVPILESLTLLSFVAGVTERIRLGSGVYLLPLRHPTITAKVAATLDVLSGGRLDLGVGVGGEFPPEFEASGVPVGERGIRANEAIEVLRKLWTGERVSHQGRSFSFGPVSIAPRPIQSGGPPIIVGGRKAPALRRAGRLGDGYLSHMCSPETYGTNLDVIRRHAAEAGRRDAAFHTAAFLFTILDDDRTAALDRAAQMLGMIYNRPFRDAAEKYCLLGTAEDCLTQIQAFVRSGCRNFVLSPLMDPSEFLAVAESRLLPGIRSLAL
jgi:probable F420-dependent oxidoreductase